MAPGGRIVLGAEAAQNFLRHPRAINHRNDAHQALADGTAQRVNVPNAQDQVKQDLGEVMSRAGRWAFGMGRFST